MVLSQEHKESFATLFDHIYKGHVLATRLSFELIHVSQVWDDIIDGDPVSNKDVNRAFLMALVDIPSNPLWDAELQANLVNTYLKWTTANVIETEHTHDDNAVAQAWMLRSSIYDMFVIIAKKVHGLDWAETIGVTVRLHYGETLEQFISEVQNA